MQDDQLKQLLEAIFGTEKVKETKQGYKVNLPEIDSVQLNELADLNMDYDVLIKRSGTGLVVNVKPMEE